MLIAALSAVFATMSDTAPTGIGFLDAIYLAIAAAMLSLAGGRSRRISWLITGLLALWAAPTTTFQLVAAVVVALGIWGLATVRHRWMGAVAGGLAALTLAHLGAGSFQGSTFLLALICASPIVLSALPRLPHGRLRIISATVSGGLAFAFVASSVFAVAAILALGDVRDAVISASAGFDQGSNGDQPAAADSMDEAAASFARARDKIGGFWSLPARMVPIVGQHVRAVQVAASEGESLSAAAADAARSINADDIRILDGEIDLTILDTLAPVASRTEHVLVRARDRMLDVRSPWLVEPLAARIDELTNELDKVIPAAETATLAARELPTMLGSTEPADWLVLTTTPAEARGLGGLVGNYIVVEATNGKVEIVAAGRNEDLNRQLADRNATLHGPSQYVDRWGEYTPERFFQDVTLSPDLPSVAAVSADLYRQATGLSVEGVVVLDPYVLESVLNLTGPVQAGDVRLSSDNVVEFLLVDQYNRFEGNDLARVLALNDLVTGTFDAFTAGGLPGPRGLADAIGPLVDSDRLGVWWAGGGGPSSLIEATGLDNSFPRPDGNDLIGLVHQNSGQNKIDVYLQRQLDYELEINDGIATGTVTATFSNDAPSSGLPDAVLASNDQGYPLGTNVALVHLHSGLDVVAATIDGIETPVTHKAAFGAKAAGLSIEVPPGQSVVVVYQLEGRLDQRPYLLHLAQQPLVNDEIASVTVTIDGAEHQLLSGTRLLSDLMLEVPE